MAKHPVKKGIKPPNAKNTPENMAAFLAGLRKGWSVAKSANHVGVVRRTVFNWRDNDEQFRADWDDAMQEGIDLLEDEALRRAVEGTQRPVFHQGEIVGTIREYSDSLLTLMLKGKRANVYNTDRVEHTGPQGGPLDHHITVEFVSAKKSKDKDK